MMERDVNICKENHLMLRKLIDIDLKRSELHKKNLEPHSFKKPKKKKSGHLVISQQPQLQMGKKSRIDELREIAAENIILMRKLNEARPSLDVREIESE